MAGVDTCRCWPLLAAHATGQRMPVVGQPAVVGAGARWWRSQRYQRRQSRMVGVVVTGTGRGRLRVRREQWGRWVARPAGAASGARWWRTQRGGEDGAGFRGLPAFARHGAWDLRCPPSRRTETGRADRFGAETGPTDSLGAAPHREPHHRHPTGSTTSRRRPRRTGDHRAPGTTPGGGPTAGLRRPRRARHYRAPVAIPGAGHPLSSLRPSDAPPSGTRTDHRGPPHQPALVRRRPGARRAPRRTRRRSR
ncbi:hypothetical protein F4561_000214 [Lipingzhangella halophila]|uniref:Uncharacterized protein n=1 Tax=Lipingzhangella halophila TaxID=1783352 RepID=A0A7W7RCH7_9ACTN|nr:hypothetical protein [Lipingzhangella halophila]